jgi:hypothetical protein
LFLFLHGDLQLFKPMSLCFLEGVEYGICILFGKEPKKLPWWCDLGFTLKTFVVLDPWQWPNMKRIKSSQITRSRGLLCKTIVHQSFLIEDVFTRW